MRKMKYILLLLVIPAIAFSLYLWFRPVQIIGVHHSGSWITRIVVKNFPITRWGKIRWWEQNKENLKEQYDVPKLDNHGYFSVSFWDIGSGYREDRMVDQDSYLLCFEDMKVKANCIEKNRVFEVVKGRNGGLQFR
ncbi:DUF943 family protein [Vibrio rhizosphaerae]|uniref:DUF943 family protein n=1 Tax=Vibrio rhizosphaerae TaxID=398736 RepID=A0ABU4IPN2_9VIBR|nr:DUF943 family protein [Vibrio rhizosphaerae]MDW6091244.1 DUF943 family protein [Vibrio rhizosphaerae]